MLNGPQKILTVVPYVYKHSPKIIIIPHNTSSVITTPSEIHADELPVGIHGEVCILSTKETIRTCEETSFDVNIQNLESMKAND
jgi:hypothetical protein